MKKLAFFFLLFFIVSVLVPSFAAAEKTVPRWFVFFDESLWYNSAHRIELDAQGNLYVLANLQTGYNESSLDILLIKYDSDGDELWVRQYDGPAGNLDYANNLMIDADGNIIVVGSTRLFEKKLAAVILKYDPDGNLLWSQMEGNRVEIVLPIEVLTDPEGNIYIGGHRSRTEGNRDFFALKYSPDGALQWKQRYAGQKGIDDFLQAMAMDESGNLYLGGVTNSDGYCYPNCPGVLVKYNNDGLFQWATNMGDFVPSQIIVNEDQDIYAGGLNFKTAKFDQQGNRLWMNQETGCHEDWHMDSTLITLSPNGGVVSTSNCKKWIEYPPEQLYSKIITTEYEENGIARWKTTFDRGFTSSIYDIQTNSTGYILTGSENFDVLTFKYDFEGNELWSATYPGSMGKEDFGTGLALFGEDSLYVSCFVNRDYFNNTSGILKYTLSFDSEDADDDSISDDDDDSDSDDDAGLQADDDDDNARGACGC